MKKLSGKLIVGQSGGCTHVINASLLGVVEAALPPEAITAVWGMRHGIEGMLSGNIIDLGAGKQATLHGINRVPAAALGSCRHKIAEGQASAVVRFCRRNDVRYFVYIGGNDSADTSHKVAAAAACSGYEMRIVAVPKTIDNDLPHTDHCPGFGSAARFLAFVTHDVGMETESMRTVEPVKVIEVMGRNAGWLAASSALAKRDERDAPHIVWPPEIPFEAGRFIELVKASLKRVGYCVAVVSETARDATGRPIAQKAKGVERDAFGHPRLADAAEFLCALVREKVGVRARWDKPGSIQRMSSAHFSEIDLREARACGAYAVRFALQGRNDFMVTMRRKPGVEYRITWDTAPLEAIANTERLLPASFFDRRRMLPTAAFRRNVLPLVGPGLPAHPRLKNVPARTKK